MLLFSLNKMSPEAHIKHKKEHAYFCKGPMKLKNSVPTKVEIKPTPLVPGISNATFLTMELPISRVESVENL